MLLDMELINNSLCPARLVLSVNVVLVSLEPFWYPMETGQFRTQLFACDHIWRLQCILEQYDEFPYCLSLHMQFNSL